MITDNLRRCDYCQSTIQTGQRWVREKIYNPQLTTEHPAYRHFHAESAAALEMSCWEKRELEKEMARIALRQFDLGRLQTLSVPA